MRILKIEWRGDEKKVYLKDSDKNKINLYEQDALTYTQGE